MPAYAFNCQYPRLTVLHADNQKAAFAKFKDVYKRPGDKLSHVEVATKSGWRRIRDS